MDNIDLKLNKLTAINTTDRPIGLATDHSHIDGYSASTSLQRNTVPRPSRSWADVTANTPTMTGVPGRAAGAYGGGARPYGGRARGNGGGKEAYGREAGVSGGGVATTDIDTDGQESDMQGYQLINGKKRRLRSPGQDPRSLLNSATHQQPAKPKPKTVIGSNTACTLKAARELTKKSYIRCE